MAICVMVHAGGLTVALRRNVQSMPGHAWGWTWLFIRLAGWIILLHLVEITAWALLYYGWEAVPGFQASVYFSTVTYTTTGYGDIVLPEEWRLVGGIEALTGILMCGWSTGFFFAIVTRMHQSQSQGGGRRP